MNHKKYTPMEMNTNLITKYNITIRNKQERDTGSKELTAVLSHVTEHSFSKSF